MVILMRNPVHSVIALIFVCLNIVNVVLGMGVEYYGIILLLVYVGAIAVLFLFVVMLINVRFSERLDVKLSYIPLAFVVGLVLCMELVFLVYGMGEVSVSVNDKIEWVNYLFSVLNVELIGIGLYVFVRDGVILGGFVLLVGIIGSLGITGRSRRGLMRKELGRV
jgi:NADH-quinone oxidoreductase subunit J